MQTAFCWLKFRNSHGRRANLWGDLLLTRLDKVLFSKVVRRLNASVRSDPDRLCQVKSRFPTNLIRAWWWLDYDWLIEHLWVVSVIALVTHVLIAISDLLSSVVFLDNHLKLVNVLEIAWNLSLLLSVYLPYTGRIIRQVAVSPPLVLDLHAFNCALDPEIVKLGCTVISTDLHEVWLKLKWSKLSIWGLIDMEPFVEQSLILRMVTHNE